MIILIKRSEVILFSYNYEKINSSYLAIKTGVPVLRHCQQFTFMEISLNQSLLKYLMVKC